MTKYFENSKGDLLVDPIEANHSDIEERTESEFKAKLAIKNTPKEKTTIEKIRDLELSITERNKQEAILGDEYAIAIIQSIRDQIEALRDQL